jgi:predicted RNase H-like HicB family nuclease
MANPQPLTAIIGREDDGFVSFCPELEIASRGSSIEAARERSGARLTRAYLIRPL